MIDLHSHILPSIDDGASSLEDTLVLAEQSVAAGVTHMMCTPHINLGTFNNDKNSIRKAFEKALSAIRSKSIPLKLSFAAEVRLSAEIIPLIQSKSLPFLGTYLERKVLLLELPHSHIPAGTDTLINWLLAQGIQPVIPHPERNREILENYEKALWLKKIGCLFQLTAGSIVGRFKPRVKDLAWQMLEDNVIAYVASDLHNISMRPNDMGEAFESVCHNIDIQKAEDLFIHFPKKLSKACDWH